MSLILLDDVLGVIVCVERVHENEGNVNIICAVEVLDLSDSEIEEGHAVTDFDNGFWTNATHGGTETTIELEDGKLAQEIDCLGVREIAIVNNLANGWWCNALPVTIPRISLLSNVSSSQQILQCVSLGLVVQVSTEQSEEVVHLGLEELEGISMGFICRGSVFNIPSCPQDQ